MSVVGRLVLFPGLGADGRMYRDLTVGSVIVPPWLPPGGDLSSYAKRYVDAGMIREGDWLGGSSFGGMLAQEIAALVPVRGLLLIGTCRQAREINLPLRSLAPLMQMLPLAHRDSHLISWLLAAKFGVTRADHRRLLASFVARADPAFLRWACLQAARWPGVKSLNTPLAQIHGSRDRLLPANRSQAKTIVMGAGHLLALSHAPAVSSWINHVRSSSTQVSHATP